MNESLSNMGSLIQMFNAVEGNLNQEIEKRGTFNDQLYRALEITYAQWTKSNFTFPRDVESELTPGSEDKFEGFTIGFFTGAYLATKIGLKHESQVRALMLN